jgi:hypothetical protein
MNPIDDQLNRLFRAARQGATSLGTEPAFGLETRVLAAWRTAQTREPGLWDMGLLVRGLIVAGVIMAISLVPALKTSESTTSPFADYLQLADASVSSDEAP